ncbi:FAD-binding protein [Hamadaea sp. NPDC051192]|uniref:FAD-binding oxidoreductase n=1 Tax=Hamadaea sp. NPDC051192 TaxID=3154940 RepID=UPI00343B82B7
MSMSRRGVLGAAALTAAAPFTAGTAAHAASTTAAVDPGAADSGLVTRPPITVGPGDVQYGDLVRGVNLRFTGTPSQVRLVTSPDQVIAAVREAVAQNKRIAVRSGGHCYEDFVANPAIQVVLDLSELSAVTYDPVRRAYVVEPGATLEKVYKTLYKGWGVTVPGGSCPSVGAGGHFAGGGYGPLSRSLGLTVDHLYGVEVVVVGADRSVRAVVATRDDTGPLRDLWWAHTGGGGGNFGIVTKYFFRTPGVTSADPRQVLPTAPREVIVSDLAIPWDGLTETGFAALLRNFGAYFAAGGERRLFSQLKPQHRIAGTFGLTTQIDAAVPDADRVLDEFQAYVAAGSGVTPIPLDRRRLPWLRAVEWPGFTGGRNPTYRFKIKSAYLRQGFTDAQIQAIHHHLTRTDYQHYGALLLITSYGGKINEVAPDATVVPQRDSILKPQFLAFWTDPADDAKHLSWVRELYRDVFAATGGVPVTGGQTDGCYVNYADADLGDPAWNTSGLTWSDLYYKQNYPRLRQVKARWDPLDTFRHAQSVRLP